MDAGIGLELDAVAAPVVGGPSLFGGPGGIPGTIVGAFRISTPRHGLQWGVAGPGGGTGGERGQLAGRDRMRGGWGRGRAAERERVAGEHEVAAV